MVYKQKIPSNEKVLVMGIDALAPDLLKRYISEGKLPTPRSPKRRFHIPIVEDQQPDSQRSYDLTKVHQALNAAISGRVEEAVILMAGVSQTTRDIELLDIIKEFYNNNLNQDTCRYRIAKNTGNVELCETIKIKQIQRSCVGYFKN